MVSFKSDKQRRWFWVFATAPGGRRVRFIGGGAGETKEFQGRLKTLKYTKITKSRG